MNISEIFIKRPVMTILVMVTFLVTGVAGYWLLPVNELPNVDFPTVTVFATLTGADPQTMAASVATPLEAQFSLIPGVDTMSSVNTQGATQITLQFRLDRNIDAAAQDVQAAIAAAVRQLPSNMPAPPTFHKVNPAEVAILQITVSSPVMSLQQVDEYAETTMVRALSSVDGVANVDIFGQVHPAVRIQADPNALAGRGIGIDQVAAAIQSANVNLATGQMEGSSRFAVVQASGQLIGAEDYARQIIAYRNGAPVRLGEVATVIDGVENVLTDGFYNGRPGVTLAINRQPGANTVAVIAAIKKMLPGLTAQLPPSMNVEITLDRSESILAAVSDVQTTLLVAAALVVLVIFLFLRTASATFIPSITLPVTVVGTFAGMAAFGYSLDNLSLMALTLCVGFVVDDAIVMLENIMRHVESGEDPFQAALTGSREIAFTILSMTASLIAVFIPVLFMGGVVGRLLHEFAVTIVIAIVISGIVSVTLTPMLCSLLIKPAAVEHAQRHSAIYRWSEYAFDGMQRFYERTLRWSLAHRRTILGIFAGSLAATVALFSIMPEDFLPSEDISQLIGFSEGANGVSFEEMARHQLDAARIIWADPNVRGAMSSAGGKSDNAGFYRIALKPRSQRLPIDQVIAGLRKKLSTIPGINVYIQNRPILTIGGMVSKAQYQYTLQDSNTDELFAAATRLKTALAQTPGFLDVTSDLDLSTPSVNVGVNRDRAAALGISMQQIETALGTAFGGQQVSTINTAADQFKVILELQRQYQRDADSLSRLYISGANGTLVPLSSVITVQRRTTPLAVNHFGQLPAVTLSFSLPAGIALSEAVSRLEQVQAKISMPAGIQTSFQGTAKAFQQSLQGMGFLLFGAIFVVYVVLGILYESFIHPLTILSGLPAAAVGALLTLWVFGEPLTLYAFVGIIMLVGIVKKNAIMMIDFALAREREAGVNARTAITEAALIRFRPIMMTTMAALVGSLPIALGLGQGGTGRQPLGLAVVGGLLLSQALTLYITPVIYGYLDPVATWSVKRLRREIPKSAE